MFKRNTTISTCVCKILEESQAPLSVKSIIERLNSHELNANKTTVYRIIKKLADQDQIAEITIKNGVTYYELKRSHHDHLICNQCDEIVCLDSTSRVPEKKIQGLADGKKFHVETHQLNVYGVCDSCVNSNRSS